MNFSQRPQGRPLSTVRPLALTVLAFSAFAAGCHRGDASADSNVTSASSAPPVIARVAGDPINKDDFYARVERIPVQQAGQTATPLDAGQLALVDMIRRKLIDKLADQKKVTPTDADVQLIVNFARRSNPQLDQSIKSGQQSEADLKSQAKNALEVLNIGVNGDKPKPEDIQKQFTAHAREMNLVNYSFHALQAPNEKAALSGIAKIKAGGTYKDVAQSLGYPPQLMAQADRVVSLMGNDQKIQPILPTLDTLKPNEVAAKPLILQNPQAPGSPAYIIVQLVSKTPVYSFKQDEARPILEQLALRETHKDIDQHFQQELASFTQTAPIEIYVDRYKPLLDTVIRQQAAAHSATAPGGSLNPGTAPSGAVAPAPGGAPSGGSLTPPPAGAGAPAPAPSGGGGSLTAPPPGAGNPAPAPNAGGK